MGFCCDTWLGIALPPPRLTLLILFERARNPFLFPSSLSRDGQKYMPISTCKTASLQLPVFFFSCLSEVAVHSSEKQLASCSLLRDCQTGTHCHRRDIFYTNCFSVKLHSEPLVLKGMRNLWGAEGIDVCAIFATLVVVCLRHGGLSRFFFYFFRFSVCETWRCVGRLVGCG